MAATRTPVAAPTPVRPRGRGRGRDSADGQVLGALLVLGGIGWLLEQTGLVELSVATMLSALLITLGIGLVVTARRSGGAGLVLVGLLLTVTLASASAVDVGVLQRGVGDRTFQPALASELESTYQLGIGSLTVDLTDLDPADLIGEHLRVRVGMGELVVVLPPAEEVPVEIVAEARAGEVDLFRLHSDEGGTNIRKHYEDEEPVAPGVERLRLDLDVGVGTVQVIRTQSA